MAQFRATIKGQRGEVSRLGNKKFGLTATVNGWNSGIKVIATFNELTQKDEFRIYITSGSNHTFSDLCIGTITQQSDKVVDLNDLLIVLGV